MFSFYPSTPSSEDVKTPVVTEKTTTTKNTLLSRQDLREISKTLPYALPALIQSSMMRKGKSRKRGEGQKFPSPQQASKLNSVWTVIQTLPLFTYTSSSSVPTFASYNVILSSFDNSTNFIAVFDQYRISLVEYTILPRFTTDTSSVTDPGRMVSVVDLDDSTNLTTFNQSLDYPGAQVTEGTKRHRHTFTPCIAVAAYSGTFTSYANESAPWIDCASSSVQHYGIKVAMSATSAAQVYDIVVRARLEFRNVR
jgi:hypothetical protein